MDGGFNFAKFAKFLKSFWGLLASLSVALPTIIFLLKTKQINDSIISEYYLSIPTTFAILIIPFAFLFEDRLSNLPYARKVSLLYIVLAFFATCSFLTIKSTLVTNSISSKYYPNTISASSASDSPNNNSVYYMQIFESKNGDTRQVLYLIRRNLGTDKNLVDAGYVYDELSGSWLKKVKEQDSINVLELISVLLFTFSIITTTASFSTLGVFYYTRRSISA